MSGRVVSNVFPWLCDCALAILCLVCGPPSIIASGRIFDLDLLPVLPGSSS